MAASSLVREIEQGFIRKEAPEFRAGDTVKVHARIVEGSKERIQIFEGVVIKRSKNAQHSNASFTVRKISYNIGVERTFLLHSPRVEKIEVVRQGSVRRSRLFYLRPLRGKAARIKTKLFGGRTSAANNAEGQEESHPLEGEAPEAAAPEEVTAEETAAKEESKKEKKAKEEKAE